MIPPVVRLGIWYHLITTPVECLHCDRWMWFPEWHQHMTDRHFNCRLCRVTYITAFDEALSYLWEPDSRA